MLSLRDIWARCAEAENGTQLTASDYAKVWDEASKAILHGLHRRDRSIRFPGLGTFHVIVSKPLTPEFDGLTSVSHQLAFVIHPQFLVNYQIQSADSALPSVTLRLRANETALPVHGLPIRVVENATGLPRRLVMIAVDTMIATIGHEVACGGAIIIKFNGIGEIVLRKLVSVPFQWATALEPPIARTGRRHVPGPAPALGSRAASAVGSTDAAAGRGPPRRGSASVPPPRSSHDACAHAPGALAPLAGAWDDCDAPDSHAPSRAPAQRAQSHSSQLRGAAVADAMTGVAGWGALDAVADAYPNPAPLAAAADGRHGGHAATGQQLGPLAGGPLGGILAPPSPPRPTWADRSASAHASRSDTAHGVPTVTDTVAAGAARCGKARGTRAGRDGVGAASALSGEGYRRDPSADAAARTRSRSAGAMGWEAFGSMSSGGWYTGRDTGAAAGAAAGAATRRVNAATYAAVNGTSRGMASLPGFGRVNDGGPHVVPLVRAAHSADPPTSARRAAAQRRAAPVTPKPPIEGARPPLAPPDAAAAAAGVDGTPTTYAATYAAPPTPSHVPRRNVLLGDVGPAARRQGIRVGLGCAPQQSHAYAPYGIVDDAAGAARGARPTSVLLPAGQPPRGPRDASRSAARRGLTYDGAAAASGCGAAAAPPWSPSGPGLGVGVLDLSGASWDRDAVYVGGTPRRPAAAAAAMASFMDETEAAVTGRRTAAGTAVSAAGADRHVVWSGLPAGPRGGLHGGPPTGRGRRGGGVDPTRAGAPRHVLARSYSRRRHASVDCEMGDMLRIAGGCEATAAAATCGRGGVDTKGRCPAGGAARRAMSSSGLANATRGTHGVFGVVGRACGGGASGQTKWGTSAPGTRTHSNQGGALSDLGGVRPFDSKARGQPATTNGVYGVVPGAKGRRAVAPPRPRW